MLYMRCPKCGCDVPTHTSCGACGAFAMSKALYARLCDIATNEYDSNAVPAVTAKLVELGLVAADKSIGGWTVTVTGLVVMGGVPEIVEQRAITRVATALRNRQSNKGKLRVSIDGPAGNGKSRLLETLAAAGWEVGEEELSVGGGVTAYVSPPRGKIQSEG